MIHIAHLSAKMLIYLANQSQIALIIVVKIVIPAKYLDFSNIFSKKSAI